MPDNKLHSLLWDNSTVAQVQALINKDPNLVKEKNNRGELPLHRAIWKDASVEVIQLLIDEYPNAVKEKTDGWLPLHVAVRKGAAKEVVQLLIKEYPDAVKEKNIDGALPLHLAVQAGAPKEVLQLLIKAYPDAAKEEDDIGNLPMDNPQIKEMYDNAFIQNLLRSQGLLGDHAKGEDLLGVKEEAKAIADIIAFKDLQTPFVVGILGGWGSGKSFTFNLMEEHLKEIQKYNLAKEVIKLNSPYPYVGHIYLIKFDVWTFAKGCLWSSLMNRILTELNDQLDLEKAIGPELLMRGVSVIELMEKFTTNGQIDYLKDVMNDESVLKQIREWKPSGGNITEALVNATNSNYNDEVKELEEKKQELETFTREFEKQKDKKRQECAWNDVTSEKSTKILPEIKQLLKDAYKQYEEANPDDPVPQTVDAVMKSFELYKGTFGRFKRYWDFLSAGKLSPLWLTVLLSSLIIAVVLPLVLDKVGGALTALGPFLSGIFVKFNDAREKLKAAQDMITEVASEVNLDKEQLEKALHAANKAQRRKEKLQSGSDECDEENQTDTIRKLNGENSLKAADGAQLRSDNNDEENQTDTIRKLNCEINSLEDRIWLREGDSLNKVVGDRLGSSNYEEHLGVVHQAQADLKRISDAMLNRSSNQQGSFPRGDPRIVLFIDDLDRCPPKKVVETLEAVQLLVKTKLFVVVLAIDAQYVTLCLENEYENILSPERHPSGLDYIEKIVQLPYRVPPISAEYMESYLQAQMNAKKPSARPNDEEDRVEDDPMIENSEKKADVPVDTPMKETAQSETKESSIAIPTEELEFTWEELQSLKDACVLSGVAPRSGRRLVNVFKLMKIIWYHRDQTPGVDTPHEVSIKEACVLILALCASSSKKVRQEMCKFLGKIEQTTSMPSDCSNLRDFIEQTLEGAALTKMDSEKCKGIFEKVKWEDDGEWILVKNDLRLLRSFSFVGEYNE